MINSAKLMHSKLTSIHPETSMLDAYKLMFDKKIRHLPVFDDKKILVGILSERDVQRSMQVEKISEVKQEILLNSEKKVGDFMSWPVFTVHEQTPLLMVIETLMSKKISSVMVYNDKEECTGIITTDDLLGYFADILKREDELKSKPLSFYLPTTLF